MPSSWEMGCSSLLSRILVDLLWGHILMEPQRKPGCVHDWDGCILGSSTYLEIKIDRFLFRWLSFLGKIVCYFDVICHCMCELLKEKWVSDANNRALGFGTILQLSEQHHILFHVLLTPLLMIDEMWMEGVCLPSPCWCRSGACILGRPVGLAALPWQWEARPAPG